MEELNELKIEYLSPDELTPYENNTTSSDSGKRSRKVF